MKKKKKKIKINVLSTAVNNGMHIPNIRPIVCMGSDESISVGLLFELSYVNLEISS